MSRWLIAAAVLVPAALAARLLGLPDGVIFIVSAASLVPVAGLIGQATEELAHHLGPRAGGLLNATFGNASELIITAFAIHRGLLMLVKASITGSIIGNTLLVLGMSLLVGGARHGIQRYSGRDASLNAAMMILAVAGLYLPATFATSVPNPQIIEELSLLMAGVLLVTYLAYLGYTLFGTPRRAGGAGRTGRAVTARPGGTAASRAGAASQGGDARATGASGLATGGYVAIAPRPAGQPSAGRAAAEQRVAGGADNNATQDTGRWGIGTALVILAAATAGAAVASELLVGTVEPVSRQYGLSEFFVGVVIVPVVGNAAEHVSAVQMAWRNRLDITLGITAGSSTQVALFVAPFLVFLSLLLGHPLNLIFTHLELLILGVATAIFGYICLDGESNWLEGAQLLAIYVMAGLVFFLLPMPRP